MVRKMVGILHGKRKEMKYAVASACSCGKGEDLNHFEMIVYLCKEDPSFDMRCLVKKNTMFELTSFFWPMRKRRKIACMSVVGFQFTSMRTARLAPIKLVPMPPALVVTRRSFEGDVGELNSSTIVCLSGFVVSPSIRRKSVPFSHEPNSDRRFDQWVLSGVRKSVPWATPRIGLLVATSDSVTGSVHRKCSILSRVVLYDEKTTSLSPWSKELRMMLNKTSNLHEILREERKSFDDRRLSKTSVWSAERWGVCRSNCDAASCVGASSFRRFLRNRGWPEILQRFLNKYIARRMWLWMRFVKWWIFLRMSGRNRLGVVGFSPGERFVCHVIAVGARRIAGRNVIEIVYRRIRADLRKHVGVGDNLRLETRRSAAYAVLESHSFQVLQVFLMLRCCQLQLDDEFGFPRELVLEKVHGFPGDPWLKQSVQDGDFLFHHLSFCRFRCVLRSVQNGLNETGQMIENGKKWDTYYSDFIRIGVMRTTMFNSNNNVISNFIMFISHSIEEKA